MLAPRKLSKTARHLLAQKENALFVSTLSLLELQYLIEIGRVEADVQKVMLYLDTTERFTILPFDARALATAIRLSGTRDPFDRTILATAIAYHLPLISKDTWMRQNYPEHVQW